MCILGICIPQSPINVASQLTFDIYREHLYAGSSIHALSVEQMRYLRWLLVKTTGGDLPVIPKGDRLYEMVVAPPLGILCTKSLRKEAAKFKPEPKSLRINFRLNTKYLEDQTHALRRCATCSSPMPWYMANHNDSQPIRDSFDVELPAEMSGPKAALYELLSDLGAVLDNTMAAPITFIQTIVAKRIKKQQNLSLFTVAAKTAEARSELQTIEDGPREMPEILGDFFANLEMRRKAALSISKDKQSLDELTVLIEDYLEELASRNKALTGYMNVLHFGLGDTQNRNAVSLTAKKATRKHPFLRWKIIGKLTNANPVQEAHKGRGGSKLKKALANQDSLKGAHGEFSYIALKKKGIVTDFTIDLPGFTSEEVAKDLVYKVKTERRRERCTEGVGVTVL